MTEASAGAYQGAHLYWDGQWRAENGRAGWSAAEPWVVVTIDRLKARSMMDVLDLGCGVGRHALMFAGAGLACTAVDLSDAGLDVLVAEAGRRGLSIQAVRADAFALPIPDEAFDYVLAWNVIYHGDAERVRASIREVRRVLRPGGLYQATMLSKRNAEYGLGVEVSPGTFVQPNGGDDKRYPHHYCDIHDVLDLHRGLDLLAAWDEPHAKPGSFHWHLLLEKPLDDREAPCSPRSNS
jgi:tellurite methyltransferase